MNRLTFVTPVPFYMETNYGLFKLCRRYTQIHGILFSWILIIISMTRECRPFPSYDHGDCQEGMYKESQLIKLKLLNIYKYN